MHGMPSQTTTVATPALISYYSSYLRTRGQLPWRGRAFPKSAWDCLTGSRFAWRGGSNLVCLLLASGFPCDSVVAGSFGYWLVFGCRLVFVPIDHWSLSSKVNRSKQITVECCISTVEAAVPICRRAVKAHPLDPFVVSEPMDSIRPGWHVICSWAILWVFTTRKCHGVQGIYHLRMTQFIDMPKLVLDGGWPISSTKNCHALLVQGLILTTSNRGDDNFIRPARRVPLQ